MIAIIGATGFTGSRTVRALREAFPDEALVAVVRASTDCTRLQGLGVETRVGDLDDLDGLTTALRGAGRVVCTASLGFGHAPTLCAALGAEARAHAICFSTTSIFTTVPNVTQQVRIAAEAAIRDANVPATILRPTMIYGRPGDRNVERLLKFLRRSPAMPTVGWGDALQQPVHVDDLAAAVVAVLRHSALTRGRGYNLPGPRPLRFIHMIRIAAEAAGRQAPLRLPVPPVVAGTAAALWGRIPLPPQISREQVLRMLENKSFPWTDARRDFGYHPRTFQQGVTEESDLLFGASVRSNGLRPKRREAAA